MRTRIVSLLFAALAMFAFSPATSAQPVSYAGKTVLITGSTDGLGRELARALAAEGAHVIIHGRNAERGQALVDEITRSGKGSASFHAADFSSLQAVRGFADTIAARYPKLDLLVNNAGIGTNNGPRQVSADGHELDFAVNYLPGWVLVNRLRPNLAAAAPSRIVNVSSLSASPIDFDDVMLEKPGAVVRGYGQSKLAQVSMTVALAPEFARDGITMISLHPASMMDTAMVRRSGRPAMTTIDEGRDHVLGLIHAAKLEPGAFYVKGKAVPAANPQPYDAAARARLLKLSTDLTGVAAR
ncbi:SDR family NAD(P)-dependent oxidoreductase [Phenylobacterium sp.]|jgi:NAD(P)-dependent dehydrogenase (short-subunit alcohol dehydrogenase family)|uniref:SDR family NAD(P)-dependent oxidoreductase n=1 Tax=Phenylobacterium sp. TaxID=1871053 RepID=UPI003783784D